MARLREAEVGGSIVTSLSAILLVGQAEREAATPPTRVYRRLPGWLITALNTAYAKEIEEKFGKLIKSDCEAETFLRVLNTASKCRPFDHHGPDVDGNFVSEPYAFGCSACMAAVEDFAGRLGVRYTVTMPTWHAPGSNRSVRITFHKPRVRR